MAGPVSGEPCFPHDFFRVPLECNKLPPVASTSPPLPLELFPAECIRDIELMTLISNGASAALARACARVSKKCRRRPAETDGRVLKRWWRRRRRRRRQGEEWDSRAAPAQISRECDIVESTVIKLEIGTLGEGEGAEAASFLLPLRG